MANSAFRLEPILLKRPITQVKAVKIVDRMRDFGLKMINRMSDYPSTSVPTYRRTGRLGRSWTMSGPRKEGADVIVEVGNNMEYAGYVQGFSSGAGVPADKKQTRLMASRGWVSVEKVLNEEWPKVAADIEKLLADS